MNTIEVMKQALVQLQRTACDYQSHGAVVELRKAIEQMEKAEVCSVCSSELNKRRITGTKAEPVAWWSGGMLLSFAKGEFCDIPLYTAPAAPDSLVVDAALVGENAILHSELRRCRAALDAAIAKYPLLAATEYVNGAEKNSIGNLRAELGTYKTHPAPAVPEGEK